MLYVDRPLPTRHHALTTSDRRQQRTGFQHLLARFVTGGPAANQTEPLSRLLAARLAAVLFLTGGLSGVPYVVAPSNAGTGEFIAIVSIASILIGAVSWLLPWQRWRASATLLLVPFAFALVATGNVADPDPFAYALLFVLGFLWIGIAHPQGTSVKVLPLFVVAYLGPVPFLPEALRPEAASAAFASVICVVSGETLAWVTQRLRLAQHALTQGKAEARLSALVRHSSELITVLGADLRIQYQSQAVEHVLGYKASALEGHRLGEFVHADDYSLAESLFAEAIARPGARSTIEVRMRHRDGAWRYIEAIVTNLLDEVEVQGLVLNSRDVTERRALESELRHQAFHDALTGLANRALFLDRVEHALARRERLADPINLLLLDLDDFKTINDSLGHAAGDALLQEVAGRLKHALRPGDTVCRLGGDEFAILLEALPGDDSGQPVAVAERVLDVVSRPFALGPTEVVITGSIGIARYRGSDTSADALLRDADVAMYLAKRQGKRRYAIFEPSLQAAAVARLALEVDLRHALDQEEFVVHYQPVVELTSGRIVSFEALVRWQHPRLGLVPPNDFIPLAEESGLIVPLGSWVLRQACTDALGWDDSDSGDATRPVTVAVNVSARQLSLASFVGDVRDALRDTGLPPQRLTLEITESAVMQDLESSIGRLLELKMLGIRLAMDDFGTGYSSLGYLRQLPIDVVKIDKSFVDAVAVDSQQEAIVRAVTSLAATLGLQTIAEGIEHQEQAIGLAAMGCHMGQGYYFARPLPYPAATQLLKGSTLAPAHVPGEYARAS